MAVPDLAEALRQLIAQSDGVVTVKIAAQWVKDQNGVPARVVEEQALSWDYDEPARQPAAEAEDWRSWAVVKPLLTGS
ncbi:MAG TPA: hypothetical protein VLW50_03780 [Streptosporangiaceae bacterium]|nr:hypothetical protein [Streptosporangiaceae bacterium]